MTRQRVVAVMAVGVLLGSTQALAQPFKCTGADGKIVYSDVRCEGPAAKAPAAAAEAKPGGRYELKEEDLNRIKALEALVVKEGAFSEQKTAAQLEIQNIRRGADARLTSAEREKRDAFAAELASSDVKKRTAALRELREIYAK
jgi:hypothetical protein